MNPTHAERLDRHQLLIVTITTHSGQRRRKPHFTPNAAIRAHLKALEKGHRSTITLHHIDTGEPWDGQP